MTAVFLAFDLTRRADVTEASQITSLASGSSDGIDLAQGSLRMTLTCTTGGAGVTIRLVVDDVTIVEAIDPVALPPGRLTFGVSRSGEGQFAIRFTDLVVNGPAA